MATLTSFFHKVSVPVQPIVIVTCDSNSIHFKPLCFELNQYSLTLILPWEKYIPLGFHLK